MLVKIQKAFRWTVFLPKHGQFWEKYVSADDSKDAITEAGAMQVGQIN